MRVLWESKHRRRETPASSLAGNVESAGLRRIVVLVECKTPRAAQTTTTLLDEDIHEGFGGKVETKHAVVQEVADENVFSCVTR